MTVTKSRVDASELISYTLFIVVKGRSFEKPVKNHYSKIDFVTTFISPPPQHG